MTAGRTDSPREAMTIRVRIDGSPRSSHASGDHVGRIASLIRRERSAVSAIAKKVAARSALRKGASIATRAVTAAGELAGDARLLAGAFSPVGLIASLAPRRCRGLLQSNLRRCRTEARVRRSQGPRVP